MDSGEDDLEPDVPKLWGKRKRRTIEEQDDWSTKQLYDSFRVKRSKELAIEGDSKHTRNALQWGEKYGAMANDIDAIHELLTNDKQLNFRRGMLEHEKQ